MQRRTGSSSTSPSNAAPRCPWRARVSWRSGTPTTARSWCTARPRPRPASGRRWRPSWGCPWPEAVLVPWAAVRLDHPVKWTEDRREHFVSSAHERGQLHHVRVGYDDDGHLLGLSVRFWHDNGAYTPYGLIVPIITSTQLLGPYKPGVYRVEFNSLYTNTVIVTPYRGAGRPQGCFVMERT